MKRWSALQSLFNRTNLLLLLIGGASLVLYRVALRANAAEQIDRFIALALSQGGLYLIGAFAVLRAQPRRSTVFIVIAFAAIFRLSILFSPPFLSDDIYRYVWDGKVQAAGVNPYRYIPSDEALSSLRDDEVYPKINRRNYAPTIYPPVAQMIYFLATRVHESVTAMKAVMIGFEVLTCWTLIQLLASFNLPSQRVLLYAWHPLLVWEIAGSGHVEAASLAFIALALLARRKRMPTATGVALACATLVKLYPLALLPALYRRWDWRMPLAFAGTLVAAYLPYLSVRTKVLGFLPSYTEEEGLRSGNRFFLLSVLRRIFGDHQVPNWTYIGAAILVLAAIAVWCLWRRERTEFEYILRALLLASTFMLLLSPRFPWYFSWMVPFLCFIAFPAVVYISLVSFVLYRLWFAEQERLFTVNTIMYLPFALLCVFSLLQFLVARARSRTAAGYIEKEAA